MANQTLKLIFTGDLLPADRQHTLGLGVGSRIDKRQELWTKEVADVLRLGDITTVNLEAPLVKDSSMVEKTAFAGRSKILDYLKVCGVTHANVANNHILEHGQEEFYNTLSLLREKGIEPLGEQGENGYKISLFQKNDFTVSLAAFNAVHVFPNPGCYAELTDGSVASCLKDPMMREADLRVLSFHWGNEYIHIPSWQQIQLARKAVDMGAHLIVGHHPHVVQPVEEYRGGLICYSLGNFLFDMLWRKSVSTGLVMEVQCNKNIRLRWKAHFVRYNSAPRTDLIKDPVLENHLSQWFQNMKKLEAQGEEAYNKYYHRQLKINRFMARLQMKKQLLTQLPSMERTYQKKVLMGLLGKIKPKL